MLAQENVVAAASEGNPALHAIIKSETRNFGLRNLQQPQGKALLSSGPWENLSAMLR
jgi:hypothetical protein